MITLKGANQNVLQSPHCATNCLQHLATHQVLFTCNTSGAFHVQHIRCFSRATHQVLFTCNTSGAFHVQHIRCFSRATLCVQRGTKEHLNFKVWPSINYIYFSFIVLAEMIDRWRREGNQSTRRKPLTMSFRKCHMLKPEIVQAPTETRTCTLPLMTG